jgi:hypothetical protein
LVSNPAGQVAGMLREVRPAAEILRELVEGAERSIARLGTCIAALAESKTGGERQC